MRNLFPCVVLLAIAIGGPAAAQVKPGTAKTAASAVRPAVPPSMLPLHSGDQVVRGITEGAVSIVRIKVFSADGQLVQQNDAVVDKSDLRFFAGLRRPLEPNQVAQVYLLVNGREVSPSNPMLVATETAGSIAAKPQQPAENPDPPRVRTVATTARENTPSAAPAANTPAAAIDPKPEPARAVKADSSPAKDDPPAPAAVAPEIRNSPKPGQSEIAVNATPTIDQTNQVTRIYLIKNGVPVGTKKDGAVQPFATTDANGQAIITLEEPLTTEDKISVQQVLWNTNTNAVVGTPQTSEAKSITDPLDLGRVRYYFTSGVIMSNNQGFQAQTSGTQAGLFLGLDADRAWIVPKTRWGPVGLNTYFDARLTSVATQEMASGAMNTPATLESFSASKKAASLQTGTYIPVVTGEWKRGTERYSFFVAPLAKAGFTTLTDSQNTNAGNGGSGSMNASTPDLVTDRFFTSYSFGARLGVFRNFNCHCKASESVAPEVVSYVDVTTGKFGNFEAFRPFTMADEVAAGNKDQQPQMGEFVRVRPWRYSFEGLLKIPHSVFVVGFNANIGHGAVGGSNVGGKIYPFTQPRDDLRFLFGARFDFSKFLKIIPQL